MGGLLHYGGLFENWEIAIAKWVINEYREKHKYLRQESFDDLVQECLLSWLSLREKYDPSREASKKTFMAGVIKKELKRIAEKLSADKRKTIYETVPLDKPPDDDENGLPLEEKIPEEKPFPPQTEQDLKIELSKVYEKLSPLQKKLCRLFGEEGLSVNEACKHFDEHRSSIYREVRRIREIFEKEGLKDYLK